MLKRYGTDDASVIGDTLIRGQPSTCQARSCREQLTPDGVLWLHNDLDHLHFISELLWECFCRHEQSCFGMADISK